VRRLNVGLIGSGFMGRSHALAWRMAPTVFGLPVTPSLELLADVDAATAEAAARAFGFRRSTGDWQALVIDPEVDLVDITTPNTWHEPMALAAIAAKKPVYCEKPLAPDAATAFRMAHAAEAAGVPTAVGFNYLKNPIIRLAREIAQSGEIGELWNYRGIHAECWMAEPGLPWAWRLDPKGGAGAVADLGSHVISMARYIVGDIAEVCADLRTVIEERPVARGSTEMRKVEVDDQARALVRFASGMGGVLEADWAAQGRVLNLGFELFGSKGSILVDLERMNELRLFTLGGAAGREGYVLVPAGPAHPDYAAFCPAPGHQLGFNEIKAIEVKEIVTALLDDRAFAPGFREAARVQAVVDAMLLSGLERRWVRLCEIHPEA
jgi:predicted dehydrogenase